MPRDFYVFDCSSKMIDESASEKETGWDDQSGSYCCWLATNEDDVLTGQRSAYQTNATTSETYFLCLFLIKREGERVRG